MNIKRVITITIYGCIFAVMFYCASLVQAMA